MNTLSQVRLDKSLFPEKKTNGQNGAIPVTPTKNSNGVRQANNEGLTILYADVHEPEEIIEMLRKEKGIYVEVKPLPASDFCFSNIGIERKTLHDFYNSIVHGDKHIWSQMFKLKHAFERPMLIIERWDDSFLSNPKIERTIRGAMASIFLMGISILVIPGKGMNAKPFVDQLSYLFFSSDKKTLSMRPIPEKGKERTRKEVISDILCMIPGIGRKNADLIKDQVNSLEELCKLSDEDFKKMCPRLGAQRLAILRWILNGQEWEKVEEESKGKKS